MGRKKTTGVIAGNFDVIHPGYVYTFQQCKKSCDELIILLHEDPSIERPHKLKPILSTEERMDVLMALKAVDGVVLYKTEEDLVQMLEMIGPDYRFLGDDYEGKNFTGKKLDIEIVYIERSHGWSTTKFKTMIKNQFNKQ